MTVYWTLSLVDLPVRFQRSIWTPRQIRSFPDKDDGLHSGKDRARSLNTWRCANHPRNMENGGQGSLWWIRSTANAQVRWSASGDDFDTFICFMRQFFSQESSRSSNVLSLIDAWKQRVKKTKEKWEEKEKEEEEGMDQWSFPLPCHEWKRRKTFLLVFFLAFFLFFFSRSLFLGSRQLTSLELSPLAFSTIINKLQIKRTKEKDLLVSLLLPPPSQQQKNPREREREESDLCQTRDLFSSSKWMKNVQLTQLVSLRRVCRREDWLFRFGSSCSLARALSSLASCSADENKREGERDRHRAFPARLADHFTFSRSI